MELTINLTLHEADPIHPTLPFQSTGSINFFTFGVLRLAKYWSHKIWIRLMISAPAMPMALAKSPS